MLMLDLTHACREPFALACDHLSPDEHHHAVHEWRGRMVSEHISARVFGGLIGPMMRAGVDAERIDGVAVMVSDELRHARLCAQVVAALGAEPIAPMPAVLPDVPSHDEVEPLEGLLRNVISISCFEETVAVSVLEAVRQRVRPAPLAKMVASILADEVRHARLGWTLLEDVSPLDQGLRHRLGEYVEEVLVQSIDRFVQPAPEASEPACALGTCDGQQDREIFARTLTTVILPGLDRFGIAAQAAADRVLSRRMPQVSAST